MNDYNHFFRTFVVRMMKNWLIVVLLFLMLPATAQKRKDVTLTPEQQEHLQKLERMTSNTQRITFIDSVVVDKQQFLQVYHLSPEVGKVARYDDYFHTTQQYEAYVYVNELENRCFFSLEQADSTISLFTSETMGDKWTRPLKLQGINDEGEFSRLNYPFMMGDGFTFYFAAEGEEGLGGYDIYVTRYDSEEHSFLRPANIGMPFNSEANDYMYVIDEYSNLGWFATDRNQPEDKVCVYIFIPPTTRLTYRDADLDDEQLASMARIDRIADTWSNDSLRQEALQRLQTISGKHAPQPATSNDFRFVINDKLTYTRLSDFRSPDNQTLCQQLLPLQERYQRLTQTLARARDFYATASGEERQELRSEILASEQLQNELYHQIRNLQKQIRNNEIIFLTKLQ